MPGKVSHYLRIDKLAAICRGRGEGGPFVGAVFVLDGLLWGGLKRWLQSHGLSKLPAIGVSLYTTYFIGVSAKETHDHHPDSLDLPKVGKEFKSTAVMILGLLEDKPEDAKKFLQTFPIDTSALKTRISPRLLLGKPPVTMNDYARLQVMYKKLKPYQVNTGHQWEEAIKHSLTFAWEYLLEVYFDDNNLIGILLTCEELSFSAFLGLLILVAAVATGYQTYYFTAKPPQAASEEELIKEFKHSFLNAQQSVSVWMGYGSMTQVQIEKESKEDDALKAEMNMLDQMSEEELTQHYAESNSARRCYFHS